MKIPDYDAYKLLEKYEIPVAHYGLARSVDEAEILLENIELPVYMKIDSPDIIHKMTLGLVKILYSKNQLLENFRMMMNSARQLTSNINGIIFQELVSGLETIIGAKHDEQFGNVVMFGAGGPMTEIIDDVSFRLIPFTRFDARTMIEDTKIYKLLEKKGIDIDEIIQVLVNVSKLAEREQIKELDINPLFVSKERIVAADVRIVK
jgi:acetyltransferase